MSVLRQKMFMIAVFVLSFSLVIAGCGNNKPASTAESASSNASPSQPSETTANGGEGKAPELEPYKITLVYPGDTPKDLLEVQSALSEYLKSKINATIELKPIDWGSWLEKTNLMFASKESFDIVISAATLGYYSNVAKGAYLPLDELIAEHGQDIQSVLGDEILSGLKVKGQIYGTPTNKEFAGANGFLFNKALVDKYNIDLNQINSLEDLDPILRMIKEKEPGITPLFEGNNRFVGSLVLNGQYDGLGDGFGVLNRNSGELKVIDKTEVPEYMEVAKIAHKWYKDGLVNKDAATVKDWGLMQAGKAFAIQQELKPGKDAEMSTAWGFPVVQKQLDVPYTTTVTVAGIMLAISKTSKDPERAMMFLNMLYSDKTLINMLDFGIENKHYVKKSDTAIDYPEGVDAKTVGYRNEAWMFGNQMNTYLFPNEDPNKWNAFSEFNKQAEKSIALGFAWDSEPVKNEIAAITNVSKQFEDAIISGSVDPEVYIPKYREALKAAGLDKVIAEKQKQLDEWAKNK
ncbi:ABC transporter substrate-binding protein [Cohnella herbarum]|uniref:ABC transporter substrate-binding protein n=1 Tax=Cohnella herbarum TaxID=2728023 RepID=A0A7Z2ZPJ8_9BACL|nr:ABC transporter substrate-binding protein [Cohnella herbarum]QJD87458.1 ABC transporter substrate-binding protein [Cohnella herbarum]